MTASDPCVVALCPIRNRRWILHRHINALRAQTVPPRIFYLEGDSTDGTKERLAELAEEGMCGVATLDTGSPFWRRDGEIRYSGDQHASLSHVYNALLDEGLYRFSPVSHFWLLDSDVLPEEGCLEELLRADKDVVAAVVEHSRGVFNFMVGERDGEPRRQNEATALGWFRGDCDGPQYGAPFPATFVSCCVLYRREVLELPRVPCGDEYDPPLHSREVLRVPRFAPHPRSHDFPWVADLKRAGHELWVAPRAKAEHVMEERQ